MERNVKLTPMVGVLGVPASAILVRLSQALSGVITTYRLGWAVFPLFPVALPRRRAELRRVTARDLVLYGASGILLVLHFFTWLESLKCTNVASSTVLVSTGVIFTAMGFALFLHGKISRLEVWVILLAFGGSALLALSGGGGAGELPGNLLALATASAAAIYIPIGRIQRGHLSTTVHTLLTYLVCFLTLLLGTATVGTPPTGYGGREWLIGLASVVLCILLGHSLFSWCLKYLSPSCVSVIKLCESVFSSLVVILLSGEVPGPLQLAGGAAVLGAVPLYTWARREKTPAG